MGRQTDIAPQRIRQGLIAGGKACIRIQPEGNGTTGDAFTIVLGKWTTIDIPFANENQSLNKLPIYISLPLIAAQIIIYFTRIVAQKRQPATEIATENCACNNLVI